MSDVAVLPSSSVAALVSMTDAQRDVLDYERRFVKHSLTFCARLQFTDSVRVSFSDGESFTIAPDGETFDYTYE